MSHRWRGRWRPLLNVRLIASVTLVSLFLWATLPYDNAIRLSVRFNVHRLLSVVSRPFVNERWLYEDPAFPVDWQHDVAIILKTGYGTQERAVAWFDAIPPGINPESVLVVGDSDFELKAGVEGPLGVKVHDVVAEVLERRPHMQFKSETPHPRADKYRHLRAAISAGEDELARNLSSSFGWELDAVKFLPALELAYRSMPRKKWYILLDDDTYLIQPSLGTLLGHFDPSTPYYIGNAVGDYRQRFAHGGSSISLSRAATQELFAGRNRRLLSKARQASATVETLGDRLLADALLRLGIHVEEAAGRFFNGEPPRASRLRADRFCAPVSTFHRLAPREMRWAGAIFRQAVDPVLWVDLWDVFHGPPSLAARDEETALRRGWDHVGRLDEHTATNSGVKVARACSDLCEARRGCLAWTWEEETKLCHLSPWVTVGEEAKGKVSGLHVDSVRALADECR